MFRRKAPDKVLDVVSTAIHGDAVAVNAATHLLRPIKMPLSAADVPAVRCSSMVRPF